VTTINVRNRIGTLGALDPAHGNLLGAEIASLSVASQVIRLDFSGMSAVSSAFANALFVTLSKSRPLDSWRSILQFVGLGPSQADVIARSLRAVRNETSHAK
jgi:hypothetical protein